MVHYASALIPQAAGAHRLSVNESIPVGMRKSNLSYTHMPLFIPLALAAVAGRATKKTKKVKAVSGYKMKDGIEF